MTSEPILDAATAYHRRGWVPVRIPRGSKKPPDAAWQKATLDTVKLATFAGHNVGVLLGKPSGDLVDVDLDGAEARALAQRILPATPCTFGRPSRPASHRLYISPDVATTRHRDPDRHNMVVELRSTGAQTVFPPSTHVEGEPITWSTPTAAQLEPARVGRHELHRAVSELAAAALLARACAPRGLRHESMLSLAGGLLLAGWTAERAAAWIEAVSRAAGHTNLRDRRDGVYATARRLATGENVAGWPSLAQLIGDPAVNAVRRWLGVTTRPQQQAADRGRRPSTPTNSAPAASGDGPDGERRDERPDAPPPHVAIGDLEHRHVRWVWAEWIPHERLAMLAGPGGTGKGAFLCDLAAKVTRGTLAGEFLGTPRRVLWYTLEDRPKNELYGRLAAAGADLTMVMVRRQPSGTAGGGWALPDDLSKVEETIRWYEDVGLVVLDPYAPQMADAVDTHKASHVQAANDAVDAMCERAGVTAIGVLHFNKHDAGGLAGRISGSSAFFDATRAVLQWGRNPTDPEGERGCMRVLVAGKNNLGPPAAARAYELATTPITDSTGRVESVLRIQYTGIVDIATTELLSGPQRGHKPPGDLDDIHEAILRELLDGAPHDAAEVIAAVRIDTDAGKRTIQNHATALIDRGLIFRLGGWKGYPSVWQIVSAPDGEDAKPTT